MAPAASLGHLPAAAASGVHWFCGTSQERAHLRPTQKWRRRWGNRVDLKLLCTVQQMLLMQPNTIRTLARRPDIHAALLSW